MNEIVPRRPNLPTAGRLVRMARFLRSSEGGLKTRLLRSGVWVGLSQLFINSLQLVRSVVLARLLTPDVFGLMAVCLTVTRGIELFSETGVRPALIHRREDFEKARDTAFCIMAVRGVVLALVASAVAPFAAMYYGQPRLTGLIFVLALSFCASGLSNVSTVRLEKDLEFRRLAIAEQLSALWSFIVVVGLAYWFRSVWSLVIGQVLGTVFGALISYTVVPSRPRFRFTPAVAKELMRYGRFISGLTIVLFLTTELDNVVVGKVLGMEQLGYYLVAYTLANLPATHISKVLSRVMFPAYSALRDDRSGLESAYSRVLLVVSSLCLAACAGLMILADDIVRVAYGPRWLASAQPLRILALFGGVRAIGAINGYLYNGIGRPNIPFYTNLAKLVAIVAVVVPATKMYGLVGVSLAVTVPMVIFYLIEIVVLDRVGAMPLVVTAKALRHSLLTALVLSAVVVALRVATGPVGVFGLLALVAVGALTWAAMSFKSLAGFYRQYWRIVNPEK